MIENWSIFQNFHACSRLRIFPFIWFSSILWNVYEKNIIHFHPILSINLVVVEQALSFARVCKFFFWFSIPFGSIECTNRERTIFILFIFKAEHSMLFYVCPSICTSTHKAYSRYDIFGCVYMWCSSVVVHTIQPTNQPESKRAHIFNQQPMRLCRGSSVYAMNERMYHRIERFDACAFHIILRSLP